MSTNDFLEYLDELDNDDETCGSNRLRQPAPMKSNHHRKKKDKSLDEFIIAQDDSSQNFKFTYRASRFEEGWLLKSLGVFFEHKWISDVLKRIKGGKEASVYLCRLNSVLGPRFAAAKVYRPRALRNLKNDGRYRIGRPDLDDEGRVIFDDRSVHAMRKRTSFGEELRHQSWIAYEFQSLQSLFAAGADVPRPYEMAGNAILMEYVGDEENFAPTLNTVSLMSDEAKTLFIRSLHNIELMLAGGLIHGDLSPYNILYWEGDITLIDFPQVVKPQTNPAAWSIFQRDVARICQYFETQGVKSDYHRLSVDLWTSHGYKPYSVVLPMDLDTNP